MRRAFLALVVLAWPAAAATAAVQHEVTIRDNSYSPADITADRGDAVRWTNVGLTPHSVTFRSGPDYNVLPQESERVPFDIPGTYRYFCRYHEGQMEGTVIVRGTTGSTMRSTTTTEPPAGSARTGPPDTSTSTSTSSTTTSVPDDEGTTTTTFGDTAAGAPPSPGGADDTDVDGAASVAALLLLAAGGAAFLVTRTSLP